MNDAPASSTSTRTSNPPPTGSTSFPALKTELPELLPDTDPRFRMDSGEMFAYFVSDDLLRNVPREQRMPIDRLVTPVMQLMFDPNRPEGVGYPGSDQFKPMTDPAGARRLDGRGRHRVPARDLRRGLHPGPRHRRRRPRVTVRSKR